MTMKQQNSCLPHDRPPQCPRRSSQRPWARKTPESGLWRRPWEGRSCRRLHRPRWPASYGWRRACWPSCRTGAAVQHVAVQWWRPKCVRPARGRTSEPNRTELNWNQTSVWQLLRTRGVRRMSERRVAPVLIKSYHRSAVKGRERERKEEKEWKGNVRERWGKRGISRVRESAGGLVSLLVG